MVATPGFSGGSGVAPPLKAKSKAIKGTEGSRTSQAVIPPGLTMRSILVAPAGSGNASAPTRTSALKIERVPIRLTHPSRLTRELDPRVHLLGIKRNCRVKPGNDGGRISAERALARCRQWRRGRLTSASPDFRAAP